MIPAEIIEGVLFTPPERGVLCEQAEGLKVEAQTLIAAVVDGNAKAAIKAFSAMAEHMSYMDSIFQAKVSHSARRIASQRSEADDD